MCGCSLFFCWSVENRLMCNTVATTQLLVIQALLPYALSPACLTLEIFSKCHCWLKLLPLVSKRNFVQLYNEETAPVPALSRRSKTAVHFRAQRSNSASTQKLSTTSRTQKAESVASVSGEVIVET